MTVWVQYIIPTIYVLMHVIVTVETKPTAGMIILTIHQFVCRNSMFISYFQTLPFF